MANSNIVASKDDAKRKAELLHDMQRQSTLIGKSMYVESVTLEDFDLKMQLGRGAFGRVYLAELSITGKKYAIKAIRKDKILDNGMLKVTKMEKDILCSIVHPFLCGMDYFFQTALRLYFVMPFIEGGDLFDMLKVKKRFTETTVKFYAMQLILGIDYLHK